MLSVLNSTLGQISCEVSWNLVQCQVSYWQYKRITLAMLLQTVNYRIYLLKELLICNLNILTLFSLVVANTPQIVLHSKRAEFLSCHDYWTDSKQGKHYHHLAPCWLLCTSPEILKGGLQLTEKLTDIIKNTLQNIVLTGTQTLQNASDPFCKMDDYD